MLKEAMLALRVTDMEYAPDIKRLLIAGKRDPRTDSHSIQTGRHCRQHHIAGTEKLARRTFFRVVS